MKDKNIDHPPHYVDGRKYEPVDVIEDWKLNFHLGCALKYISRVGRKGNEINDIDKAIWYLKRYKELFKKRADNLGTEHTDKLFCVHCGGKDIVKYGKRKNKSGTKQKYICNICKKKWSEGSDQRMKGDKKTMELIMSLHKGGASLRQIEKILKKSHKINLTHTAILRRLQKENDYR